ncbi:uncharacterized protein CLUP02_09196 [Colletotrichum lupini]|uniref:Uncharacterized protein n=1 Tax=Colletotrichum lupini TaxID=145971 RepID=A0A9Q8SUH4_9PEZI|nr:uncharacterized protein CLUP02_09196 [Colletotrichum lupini]UQC83700.1 hypothetical protein CLUP02_09196 [Colletotrichum lupini]
MSGVRHVSSHRYPAAGIILTRNGWGAIGRGPNAFGGNGRSPEGPLRRPSGHVDISRPTASRRQRYWGLSTRQMQSTFFHVPGRSYSDLAVASPEPPSCSEDRGEEFGGVQDAWNPRNICPQHEQTRRNGSVPATRIRDIDSPTGATACRDGYRCAVIANLAKSFQPSDQWEAGGLGPWAPSPGPDDGGFKTGQSKTGALDRREASAPAWGKLLNLNSCAAELAELDQRTAASRGAPCLTYCTTTGLSMAAVLRLATAGFHSVRWRPRVQVLMYLAGSRTRMGLQVQLWHRSVFQLVLSRREKIDVSKAFCFFGSEGEEGRIRTRMSRWKLKAQFTVQPYILSASVPSYLTSCFLDLAGYLSHKRKKNQEREGKREMLAYLRVTPLTPTFLPRYDYQDKGKSRGFAIDPTYLTFEHFWARFTKEREEKLPARQGLTDGELQVRMPPRRQGHIMYLEVLGAAYGVPVRISTRPLNNSQGSKSQYPETQSLIARHRFHGTMIIGHIRWLTPEALEFLQKDSAKHE